MTTPGQIKALQKRVQGLSLDSRVHFYNSQQEYDEAFKSGKIKVNDVCIIDDISNDGTSVITQENESTAK